METHIAVSGRLSGIMATHGAPPVARRLLMARQKATGRSPTANQRKGLRRNVSSLQALIDADSDVLLDWLATALAMTTRHQAPLSIKERLSTDQGRVAAAGDHAVNAVGREPRLLRRWGERGEHEAVTGGRQRPRYRKCERFYVNHVYQPLEKINRRGSNSAASRR
jgi:hypothetical protein